MKAPKAKKTFGKRATERREPDSRVATEFFFNHGLGDAVMLRSILPAVKRQIVLSSPASRRYDGIFAGLNHVTLTHADEAKEGARTIKFYAEDSCLPIEGGRPIKPRISLEYDFGVIDYTYRIRPPRLSLPGPNPETGGPYVVLSLHGASSPARKDCPLDLCGEIITAVLALGMRPVVINYAGDRSYSMPAGAISTEGWPREAGALWQLLKGAQACIGIDSGPLHLALTIPGLPCLFLKNKIDFMRFFYDGGLEQIREIVDVNKPNQRIQEKVKKLCLSEL